MVFGVHGDWGAGKTSFLQAVMYALTGNCPRSDEPCTEDNIPSTVPPEMKDEYKKWHQTPPHAVWFEAWRYHSEAAPIVALLHQLRDSLTGLNWVKEKVKGAGAVLKKNLLLALDSIILKVDGEAGVPYLAKGKVGASISPFHFSKASQEVARDRHSTPLASNQIREALDNILGNLLDSDAVEFGTPPPDKRVVIFIDDLDRCAAAAMFSLLESIKIYLNLRHCVFVLGINRHEVERGIISVLPEAPALDQRQVRSHEYIEKLCGNVIRLPYPNKVSQKKMLDAWLHLDSSHKENDFLIHVADIAVAFGVLPQNPRRIKMWCNTVLQMYEHRLKEIGEKLPNGVLFSNKPMVNGEASALVLMACLYTFYPVLHQAMVSCEDQSFLGTLDQWCQADRYFDLAIFDGVYRVFAFPSLIQDIKDHLSQKIECRDAELLRRYYAQPAAKVDDRGVEPPTESFIPLLTDPSSLSYFHPQLLVAAESITEAQIKPYLHLD